MPGATSPINRQTWLRQTIQQAEEFGLEIRTRNGGPGQLYDEDTVYNPPANPVLPGFSYITQSYSPGGVLNFAANPQRKVLIIENQGTTPIWVSFGITASLAAKQGILLPGQGDNILLDRNCPTNSFYVDAGATGSFNVTQGTPGP